VVVCLVAVGAAVGGYLVGSATAPTSDDFSKELEEARSEGFEASHADAFAAARARGEEAGRRAGSAAGAATGRESGAAAGSDSADQATAAPAPLLVELPNGELGYSLPEEQRTLGCVGVEADSGQCVGD